MCPAHVAGLIGPGVAPQYASSLGKNANCQTMVSVTLASGEVPVMVGLRLFLPESWTSDPERLARVDVPLLMPLQYMIFDCSKNARKAATLCIQ